MATRSETEREPGTDLSPKARQVLIAIGVLVCLAVVTRLLWNKFGARIQANANLALTLDSFEVTEQPPWIRSDVRAEAVRDGSLSDLTIDLHDLSPRVAQAFLMHSWVDSVHHVGKRYPGRVIVDVAYRKPVAMVEVTDPAGNRGLFPVDSEGVFLPPGDFMPSAQPVVDVESYPRLRSDGLFPTGQPGTPWGDIRVVGGAKLAGFLVRHWQRLELLEIVALRGRRTGAEPGPPTFELRTARNTVILWGHAPEAELAGEATSDKKLAQLLDFVEQHGTLDSVAPDQTIDVRHVDGLEVATVGRQLR